MQVNVRYLENVKLEALFDDFSLIADQPVRYSGDGSAPGPFDYFLASSALCAAYFVKVYCRARDISTEDIKISQDNIIDPENRYKQKFHITAELPESISEKDRTGIINSIERCTVKRVIQNDIDFIVETKNVLGKNTSGLIYERQSDLNKETMIIGKDSSLEESIKAMSQIIEDLGIKVEIASWRNQVPYVWSVHVRDADSPMCYTNGKGATKDAALCSALGEYLERISNNYFYNDYYLGKEIAAKDFVHYPEEKWFKINISDSFPEGLMDDYLFEVYNIDNELTPKHLIEANSGTPERGICAIPFKRQSDKKISYIPVNLIGNLFVSNGMSAGNTIYEARVQALSEIFERAIKNKVITEQITLPDVPIRVLNRYPKIMEGIIELEKKGFPLVIKDSSLGGKFPVMCITLMSPKTGGVFASFGAHPNFEVALERCLTELLQGRSFEGLNIMPPPTFNEYAITEHNNIIDHFIDSTGVISWKFFSEEEDYEFRDWNFSGSTKEEFSYLIEIFNSIDKEVYIADYKELGANACRILVPDYSEIYLTEDLVWDNSNKALEFRADFFNIHQLSKAELYAFIEKFDHYELDDHMNVSELIGITFEEGSILGILTIGELKALAFVSLGDLESAKEHIEGLLSFNEHFQNRRLFFQALNTAIDIKLSEDQKLESYQKNLKRMFGEEIIQTVMDSISGKSKFYGIPKIDENLTGLIKHQKLIDSYKKLHIKRANN